MESLKFYHINTSIPEFQSQYQGLFVLDSLNDLYLGLETEWKKIVDKQELEEIINANKLKFYSEDDSSEDSNDAASITIGNSSINVSSNAISIIKDLPDSSDSDDFEGVVFPETGDVVIGIGDKEELKLSTNGEIKTVATDDLGVFVITQKDAKKTTTKVSSETPVAPYNTSYGFTNITINTIDPSKLKDGLKILMCCDSTLCCSSSSYRNVRIRFGSSGAWIPVFLGTSICAGNSYLGSGSNRLMLYRTDLVSTGGFYILNDNNTYSIYSFGIGYGTCSTEEATTTKIGVYSNYTLTKGGIVAIKFTNAVPAKSTLNINSKGEKPITYHDSEITDGIIKAGDTATFVYDGTNYVLLAVDSEIGDLSTKADKATTLEGYGITDAQSKLTYYSEDDTNVFASINVEDTSVNVDSSKIELTSNEIVISKYIDDDSDSESDEFEGIIFPETGDVVIGVGNNDSLKLNVNGEIKTVATTEEVEELANLVDENSIVASTAITDLNDKYDDLEVSVNTKAEQATTLEGYGITDAYISGSTIKLGNDSVTIPDVSNKADKATTLEGYGITDAQSKLTYYIEDTTTGSENASIKVSNNSYITANSSEIDIFSSGSLDITSESSGIKLSSGTSEISVNSWNKEISAYSEGSFTISSNSGIELKSGNEHIITSGGALTIYSDDYNSSPYNNSGVGQGYKGLYFASEGTNVIGIGNQDRLYLDTNGTLKAIATLEDITDYDYYSEDSDDESASIISNSEYIKVHDDGKNIISIFSEGTTEISSNGSIKLKLLGNKLIINQENFYFTNDVDRLSNNFLGVYFSSNGTDVIGIGNQDRLYLNVHGTLKGVATLEDITDYDYYSEDSDDESASITVENSSVTVNSSSIEISIDNGDSDEFLGITFPEYGDVIVGVGTNDSLKLNANGEIKTVATTDQIDELTEVVNKNSFVTSSSLNDLNKKLSTKSDLLEYYSEDTDNCCSKIDTGDSTLSISDTFEVNTSSISLTSESITFESTGTTNIKNKSDSTHILVNENGKNTILIYSEATTTISSDDYIKLSCKNMDFETGVMELILNENLINFYNDTFAMNPINNVYEGLYISSSGTDVIGIGKKDRLYLNTKGTLKAIATTDDIPVITDTYSSTSTDGMSGIAVATAVDELKQKVLDDEEAVATSLNDLNTKYNSLETQLGNINTILQNIINA